MDAGLTLKAIESLVKSMANQNLDERVKTYATLKVLSDELAGVAKRMQPNVAVIGEELLKLLRSCAIMSRLETGDGNTDDQHLVFALGALSGLRSAHCFNIGK